MALLRLLLALGLVWLCYRLGLAALVAVLDPKASSLQVTTAAAGSLLSALGALVLMVRFVLPDVGEFLGNLIFNPGGHAPATPREAADEKAAWGDYEGAARAYEKILQREPDDLEAWLLLSRLQAEKIGRPAEGIATLHQALEHEWHPHDEATLLVQLAELEWHFHHTAVEAHELIQRALALGAEASTTLRAGNLLRQLGGTLPPG